MSRQLNVRLELADGTVIRASGSTYEGIMAVILEQIGNEHAVVISLKVSRPYVARRVAES